MPVINNPDGEAKINWRTVALVGVPIGLAALGVAGYYYYYKSRSSRKNSNVGTKRGAFESNDPAGDAEPEPEDPLERAIAYKNKGNKYFKGGKFAKAIECYSDAIRICPTSARADRATFFQNRAASYEALKKIDYVLQDCNSALELQPKYAKALTRRARVHETMDSLSEALNDVTAACIVEQFQNAENLTRADRVLKTLGKKLSAEAVLTVKPSLPSDSFVRTFLSAFAHDPLTKESSSSTVTTGEDVAAAENGSGAAEGRPVTLQMALAALRSQDYERAYTLAESAVEELQPSAQSPERLSAAGAEALLLRATLDMLSGRRQRALTDLGRVADCTAEGVTREMRVNALIKRASLIMQDQQDLNLVQADFERAVSLWPECSDIYHHRGQMNLILDQGSVAIEDLKRAVKLNPMSSIAQSQRVYAEYRMAQSMQDFGRLQACMEEFDSLAETYPSCMEVHSLRGQALADNGRFDEAEKCFKQVADLDPTSGTALVHRGLLLIQWKQDMEAAMSLIRKAIEVDERCEFALETLATMEVQRGNFEAAKEFFERAIALTKSEPELAHLISLREAVRAQQTVCARLELSIPQVLQATGAAAAMGRL